MVRSSTLKYFVVRSVTLVCLVFLCFAIQGWGGLRSIRGHALQSNESSRKSLLVGRSLVYNVHGMAALW